ncbi:MAG: hypothetical protein ACJ746_08180 [Bryobacteraceae bacterium]
MELKDGPGGVPIAPDSAAPQTMPGAIPSLGTGEELVGKRVQIRAVKAQGSARLLDGLMGTVIGMHPIARGWVKLDLDQNPRTPHRDWSVATDRLVLVEPGDVREVG